MSHNLITDSFAYIICGMKVNPLCKNVVFQIGGPKSDQFNDVSFRLTKKFVYAIDQNSRLCRTYAGWYIDRQYGALDSSEHCKKDAKI